jgi:hypothetical protein
MKHIAVFSLALALSLVPGTAAHAQLEVDQSIQLTGTTEAERRITGLGDPGAADHAVNAGTIQEGSLTYAEATGSANAYVVALSPAVTAYTTGMTVNFKANAANTGACTLNAGAGAVSIRKQVTTDLAANDIRANQLVTVIYDGTNFQMISASGNAAGGPAACPSGFTNVNNNFCIETNERTAAIWSTAYTTCAAQGAGVRMCEQVDFYYACTQAGTLGLLNMSNNEEWAHGQDNGNPGMKTIANNGGCSAMNWSNIGNTRNYRCCFYR